MVLSTSLFSQSTWTGSGEDITFKSGGNTSLDPGFEVENGALFQVLNEDCMPMLGFTQELYKFLHQLLKIRNDFISDYKSK